MKLLLDTHIVIWALTNDEQLCTNARDLLTSPNNIALVSVASLWEIAVKNQKAPDRCPYNEKEILGYCEKAGYEVLDIAPKHVLSVRDLRVKEGKQLSNHDPFDRLLIAKAKSEGGVILSHDSNFDNYDEPCILKV